MKSRTEAGRVQTLNQGSSEDTERSEERSEATEHATADGPYRTALNALAALHGGRAAKPLSVPISKQTERTSHPCRVVLLRVDGSAELLGRAEKPYLACALAYAFIARTLRTEVEHGTRILAYENEWSVDRSWRMSATGWKETKVGT